MLYILKSRMLNWFHDIKIDIMEVSHDLDNALNKMNPNDRVNRYNDFMKSISRMNASAAAIFHTMYFNIVFHSTPLSVYRKGRDLSSPCHLLTRLFKGCASPTHNLLIYKAVHHLLYLVYTISY